MMFLAYENIKLTQFEAKVRFNSAENKITLMNQKKKKKKKRKKKFRCKNLIQLNDHSVDQFG